MNTVNTVLGPVAADALGIVAVHEALLSVVPGAEHAYDVTIDRAEIFEILARKLPFCISATSSTPLNSDSLIGRTPPPGIAPLPVRTWSTCP